MINSHLRSWSISRKSSNDIYEPSTSSSALTKDLIEGESTVSTVKVPYIIENNNAMEDDKEDKVIVEARVDNALDFNTVWGRGVIRSLNRSRMVVFASTGLFIAFCFHIC